MNEQKIADEVKDFSGKSRLLHTRGERSRPPAVYPLPSNSPAELGAPHRPEAGASGLRGAAAVLRPGPSFLAPGPFLVRVQHPSEPALRVTSCPTLPTVPSFFYVFQFLSPGRYALKPPKSIVMCPAFSGAVASNLPLAHLLRPLPDWSFLPRYSGKKQ